MPTSFSISKLVYYFLNMKVLFPFFCIFISFSLSNGAVQVVKTITVDRNGRGDFNTIQAAIDSIPYGNDRWIRIRIKAGDYYEKVNVPTYKGFVVLEGVGAQQTTIQWGDYAPPSLQSSLLLADEANKVAESATFTVSADNVVVKGLTFKNTYGNSRIPARAIAALIEGDRISFYNCNFIGIQDTMSDLFGRHYFKDCYIEGAVDFIFGLAQSLYEDCTLSTVASNAVAGWVTAHGRTNESDSTGFVFKNCKLTGSAKTYLGRAWGSRSRVIFYQTEMSDVVVPDGWDYWSDPSKGIYTTYVESACTGQGSDTSARVKWVKTPGNMNELVKFTSITFVDDGWLSQQGW